MQYSQKNLNIQPLSMNSNVDNIDPILQKVKVNEKRVKKCNPFAWSPFMCTTFQKNGKYDILLNFFLYFSSAKRGFSYV